MQPNKVAQIHVIIFIGSRWLIKSSHALFYVTYYYYDDY